jgi:hypothetical protein
MVLAVSSNTQAASLDSREAEADCLAQGRSVDVRDAMDVADVAVGIVQSLAGDIAVCVGGIVGGEPEERYRLVGNRV